MQLRFSDFCFSKQSIIGFGKQTFFFPVAITKRSLNLIGDRLYGTICSGWSAPRPTRSQPQERLKSGAEAPHNDCKQKGRRAFRAASLLLLTFTAYFFSSLQRVPHLPQERIITQFKKKLKRIGSQIKKNASAL